MDGRTILMQSHTNQRLDLSHRWLFLAKAIWFFFVVTGIFLWTAGAYASLTEPLPDCAQTTCDPFGISQQDYRLMLDQGLPADVFVIFWNAGSIVNGVIFLLTGAFIYWQRRDDTFALMASVLLVFLGSVGMTEFDDAVYRSYPALRLPLAFVFSTGWGSLILMFFFFPDGRLVPDRQLVRWILPLVVLATAAFTTNPARRESFINQMPIILLVTITGLLAQIYRYRKVSNPVQRQQTKWVLYGLAGVVVTMLIWGWMGGTYPPDTPSPARISALLLVRVVIVFSISLLPVSFTFSILRYRLWDIDILIRRTLSYSLLTGILLAVYFSGVILLQELFRAVSGETSSPVITVISTLAIAALFNPLRSKVQDFIDQRFYRSKYDAQQTLSDFSQTTRDEVDLESLSMKLFQAVDETMKPEKIQLLLNNPEVHT